MTTIRVTPIRGEPVELAERTDCRATRDDASEPCMLWHVADMRLEFGSSVRVDADACRRFLRYVADVAALNEDEIPLPLLMEASVHVAMAVMRLGTLPLVSDSDLQRVATAYNARHAGSRMDAAWLQCSLRELAVNLVSE